MVNAGIHSFSYDPLTWKQSGSAQSLWSKYYSDATRLWTIR